MGGKEKKEFVIKPDIFKFGAALAFSLGGIFITILRSKSNKPPKSNHSQCASVGHRVEADLRQEDGELSDDLRVFKDLNIPKVSSRNSISDRSSSERYSGERDGFLVPEFNQLIRECNLTSDDISPRIIDESMVPDIESPREYKCSDHEEHSREIRNLREKVKILEERERILEIQLLEYYGLKEQETAVMELQNRLRLSNMEAKLYNLKIDSLQSDNQRLVSQLSDYERMVTELEASKAKIRLLRKKLKSEAEKNREQILSLQERVMKLHDSDNKPSEIDHGLQINKEKTKEMENELEGIKKQNESLKTENAELAQKLEYVQMLATSAIDNEEIEELKKQSELIRQQNEDLKKEIEQLQADRCADIEELVYLRWINACLRYEMRNHQPLPGETIARDLSKTLDPTSEQKAKQLILDYATKEGLGGREIINASDFDSDGWSTSQASYITDSGENEDCPPPEGKAHHQNPKKVRVFAKLMKLLRGGKQENGGHHRIQTSSSSSTPSLGRAASMDDIGSRFSSASHSVQTTLRPPSATSSRHSFDLHRSFSRGQKSNAGESRSCSRQTSCEDVSLNVFRTIDSIGECGDNDPTAVISPDRDAQNAAKAELMKYAEALKSSTVKKPSFGRRRSASFSSF